MPKRPTVLLDANVIWSPQQRNLILQIAAAEEISVRWSREIEDEWLRNTDERTRARLMSHTLPLLHGHFPDAWIEGFDPTSPFGNTDKKDRHVAAAAEKVAPSILATWNVKDFDVECLRKVGVQVKTPDELLSELFDANPDLIFELAREAQANLTKSAPTWDAYLDTLLKCKLRTFVDRLQKYDYSSPMDEDEVSAIKAVSDHPTDDTRSEGAEADHQPKKK